MDSFLLNIDSSIMFSSGNRSTSFVRLAILDFPAAEDVRLGVTYAWPPIEGTLEGGGGETSHIF